ncbi:MAG: lyase family protein [Patescibacteria group bacterium]
MHQMLTTALDHLQEMPKIIKEKRRRRNWQMPGDPRYQPDELKPYLGYDQWAAWLIIVEWFWMMTLAKIGIMPEKDAELLTQERLFTLLDGITTEMQDQVEKRGFKTRSGKVIIEKTNHDILALLFWIRRRLPKPLHKWLHLGATSYDIICTAYALQAKYVFERVFWPKMRQIDEIWRAKIREYAEIIQEGRTHLQPALPITVGFWLAGLHNRFIGTVVSARDLAQGICGKFSGAIGTAAGQEILLKSDNAESMMMDLVDLKPAKMSTQVAPPESMARYYFELVLMSGALGNLGEDVRILQSHRFGELMSDSSSSSAMPHKRANPIAAEQDAGMHVDVIAEFMKVLLTLITDLGRDLRWSCVMRSFSTVMVYAYQQLLTTERLLKSIKVNEEKCRANFNETGNLVVAELLHLALQMQGYENTHHLLNKIIVPAAVASGNNLNTAMCDYIKISGDQKLRTMWSGIPEEVKLILNFPNQYIGRAIRQALKEADNGI